MKNPKKKDSGFILLYVVIAVTIFVALASSVISSTVTQVELGAQELSGTRATIAADMALECMSYYATRPERPFYTNTPAMNIVCGPGMSFDSVGGASGPCTDTQNAPFVSPTMTMVASGDDPVPSCAQVRIQTRPRKISIRTAANTYVDYDFCALRIEANGFDGACGANSETTRTRWEDVGGYNGTLFPATVSVDARSGQAARPAEESVNPNTNIPTAKQVSLVTSPTSVFQMERSGTAGFRGKTNPVRFTLRNLGALLNPVAGADAGPIDITVKPSSVLNTALSGLGANGTLDVQITNPSTGALITKGFAASSTFDITLGVPSNLPTNTYLLRVTALYLSASSSVLVPFEVSSSTRGQF